MTSWLKIKEDSDFSIHNLPFGIFSNENASKRVGVAIGAYVLDLSVLLDHGYLKEVQGVSRSVIENDYCNDLIALGKKTTNTLREQLKMLLTWEESPIKDLDGALIDRGNVTMHLPVKIGDYTDYYSSIEHATNVGKMFRDPENALLPNWRHLPVGYHGRASSIVESGIPIRRPMGQTTPKDSQWPIFKPTERLDFELEVAFIIGKDSKLGDSIPIAHAEDYIFGLVLFNDWSARDIQKWEYVPLGPFLGKNFASSMSPWIVPLEALKPFRVPGPKQEPSVLSYLDYTGDLNIDINLEVGLQPNGSENTIISKSNFKYMYWNMAQQLAHHTVNGCNVRVGDTMASGTISGKDESSYGSMLEISWGGKKPKTLNDGEIRSFIEDGDTVTMKGYCQKDNIRVGFGEVRSKVLPSK